MFNFILPYTAATLTQVRWLFLNGIDIHHIDVTDVTTVSCVLSPLTVAVFFGNKLGSTPHHMTDSKIPTPTQPQQHDTHIRAYWQHVAAMTWVAQQNYIEKWTVLCAGLKIMAPQPKNTMRPVTWAPMMMMTTLAMTSYVIKLPTAHTGANQLHNRMC